ncbi:hypothetical protein N9Z19_02070 [Akkermansiaceae bacterium]|nr:hypothetical protein [Akkermansiaceae bacterium]
MAVLFVSCGFAFGQGLNNGLVAYYPFNGNATDESGNGNDGVVNGAVLATDRSDQENSAYFFDGNDFVSIGNPLSLRLSEDFSISSWALFTSNSGADRILSFNQEFGYELGVWDGNPWFAYGRINHRSSQVIQPNTWFNLTVTKTGNLIRLYLNGAKILEESNPNNPTFSRELRFGQKSQQDSWWTGKIDDTRFYDRALSNQEISSLFALESQNTQFQIIEGNFTWQEAKADAEAKGGHLATVTSSQEMSQLSQLLRNYEDEGGIRPSPWIGGFEAGSPLEWRWVTGEPFSYENWYIGLTTVNPPGNDEIYLIYGSGGWEFYPTNRSGSRLSSYILEIILQNPAPPLVQLGALYESPSGEAIVIDATPTAGFPAEYTYQWRFNGFTIPAALGGAESAINIDNLPDNEGTWSVTVTNETGSVEQSFEYRIYADSDSDGLSDAYEELISMSDINNPDTDADGLRDAEEVNDYRTNPNSSDSDSDGFTDLYELETAYDPNSAESTPDAQVNIMTAIEVDFNAALGATYEIQFSTDTIEWTVIEAGIVGEGNAVERLYTKKDFPTGFFRVERTDQ